MLKQSSLLSVLSGLLVATVVGLDAGRAQAQTDAAAGTTTPPPATTTTSSHAGAGSGAGLGVGAAAFLSGLTGAQVVYDMPLWQIEALLAFDSRDANGGPNPPRITTFDVGVSAWYHLHQGASSDFSLGGGLGILTASGGGNSATATVLEVGAQARVFVTANVAVHGRLGLDMGFGDNVGPANNHVGFGGQIVTGFGFTYFFR